jgi:colicin import membrane protein
MSWRYVVGAILLHILFMGVFALTLVSIERDAPPPQLAIQAVLVDPSTLKRPSAREQRARERAEAQRKQEQQRREEEKQRQDEAKQREQETQRVEQERQETERRAEEQRQVELKQREEQQREQQQREQQEQREREVKAKREADAETERKRVAEIERKQKEREAEQRRVVEQRAQEARESELQQQLANEESEQRLATSGVFDKYRALIESHIYRYWNRPPSARAGVQCDLKITQAPGGVVLTVEIGECNGDAAMRQSIENAVLRASPLPLPPDPRAFERVVILQFKPRD